MWYVIESLIDVVGVAIEFGFNGARVEARVVVAAVESVVVAGVTFDSGSLHVLLRRALYVAFACVVYVVVCSG